MVGGLMTASTSHQRNRTAPPPIQTTALGPRMGTTDDEVWGRFTSQVDDYELGVQIGFGASSTVYAALFRPGAPGPGASPSVEETIPSSDVSGSSSKPGMYRPLQLDTVSRPAHNVQALPCAIKVCSARADITSLSREIKLLSLCRHPNVLRILATFTLPPDNQRVYIVSPLIEGGSLAGILDWRSRLQTDEGSTARGRWGFPSKKDRESEVRQKGNLTQEEIKAVAKQVLEGLRYLHERSFIHRDIKAGNLLVAADGTVLLADFGVGGDLLGPQSPMTDRPTADAIRFERPVSIQGQSRTGGDTITHGQMGGPRKKASFVGTPGWMAPEVILGQAYDDRADVWSLGMTIIELAEGSVPNSDKDASQIISSRLNGPAPTLRPHGHDASTKGMQDFVDHCLLRNPADRPSASQLATHHWLKHAKGPAFVASALLTDVPPLEARQEVRRMPSLGLTPASPAPSWDFNPSAPSSPLRTAVRSPSIISGLRGDYFPPTSRAHSRSSTRSKVPSLPPSPRIPLRQWAERTASSDSVSGLLAAEGLKMRTPSEGSGMRRGAQRSQSSLGLRRRQSPSVDGLFGRQSAHPSAVQGLATEIDTARRWSSAELGYEESSTVVAKGTAMSPLIEAAPSGDGQPPNLLLSSSPEALPALNVQVGRKTAQPPDVGITWQARTDAGTPTFSVNVPLADRGKAKHGLGGLIRSITGKRGDAKAA